MTTTIAALPFFGGSLSGFDPSANSVVDNGSIYDHTWSTGALAVPINEYATSVKWPSASDFWLHFVFGAELPNNPVLSEVTLIQFLSGGVEVAKITVTGFTAMTFYLYTRQSSVQTLVGTSNTMTTYPGVLNTVDINIKAGAAGVGALYTAGTENFRVTGLNNADFSGIDQIRFFSVDSNIFHATTSYWSQVICDTTSTIGRFVRTDRLDSNSAVNTGWTGSVSDINELPTSDANFILSATPGQVSTFYESGMSLSGYQILARGVSARMRVQGSGPGNEDLAIRSQGANYFATPIAAGTGYQASFNSWTTDPAGGNWNPTTAAGSEVGAKSAA